MIIPAKIRVSWYYISQESDYFYTQDTRQVGVWNAGASHAFINTILLECHVSLYDLEGLEVHESGVNYIWKI